MPLERNSPEYQVAPSPAVAAFRLPNPLSLSRLLLHALLQRTGKRRWFVARFPRTMIRVRVLKLYGNRASAICQWDFLKDLAKRIRFENREITAFLSLLRRPTQKFSSAGIVTGADRILDIWICSRFIEFVVEGSDDIFPRFIEHRNSVDRAIGKLLGKNTQGIVNRLCARMDRSVVAPQSLSGVLFFFMWNNS